MDLTGAQIKQLLKEQVTGANAASSKILQVSKGFSYTYTADGTISNMTLDGAPVTDGATYRIVTNNFLSDGGDGFPTFKAGTNKYFGGLDIDAFANYLEANDNYTPGPLTRITKQ
jgi:5'-nucleotidase